MTKRNSLPIASILIALALIIPMFMIKIVIPPASFTLASHVPIFIAMFISPGVAVAVALGSAFGFFLTATPEIALRALSHVIFAVLGALYVKRHPRILEDKKQLMSFNLIIALIHAACEVLIVIGYYAIIGIDVFAPLYVRLLSLVFFGGIIHSFIDFLLACIVIRRLPKR